MGPWPGGEISENHERHPKDRFPHQNCRPRLFSAWTRLSRRFSNVWCGDSIFKHACMPFKELAKLPWLRQPHLMKFYVRQDRFTVFTRTLVVTVMYAHIVPGMLACVCVCGVVWWGCWVWGEKSLVTAFAQKKSRLAHFFSSRRRPAVK